jgi:Domain of unknown function (DUF4157)
VRVHTGPDAVRHVLREFAHAVTIGSDILFGPGQHRPGSDHGDRLLAHEVAHAIQQAGGDRPPGGAFDPEQAADRAAAGVVRHGAVGFGLRAAPAFAPARKPASWKEQVAAANAIADPKKKSAALTALVQAAISGRTVRQAGTSSKDAVDPADYDAVPAINFDPLLNSKKKWHSSNVASNNVGYTFSITKGKTTHSYSILGPMAIDGDKGQVWTQMYADHELYHAAHDLTSTASDRDPELEPWTHTFVTYFLQVPDQRWVPIITYYETAEAKAQAKALDALAAFAGGLSKADRAKFDDWLGRRLKDSETASKKLIVDLDKKLGSAAAPAPAPTPAPTGSTKGP